MSRTRGLKPGEKAPNSGQYQVRGPRGGKGDEVTVPKGHQLPPTAVPGATYDLVDRTKNESGLGK